MDSELCSFRLQGEDRHREVVGWASLEGRCDVAGQGEARVVGLHSEGALASRLCSTRVAVEEYSGTSSVVVYSMHILVFNQRRDE